MLRNSILSVHLSSVIVWLGAGSYELYVSHQAKRYAGTDVELPLLRMVVSSGKVIAAATVLVAATGLLMALVLHWGFFQTLWLGTKQGIMLAVLGIMAWIWRPFYRAGALMDALPPGAGPATPEIRRIFESVVAPVLVMRAGALAAVLLAVWRPS